MSIFDSEVNEVVDDAEVVRRSGAMALVEMKTALEEAKRVLSLGQFSSRGDLGVALTDLVRAVERMP